MGRKQTQTPKERAAYERGYRAGRSSKQPVKVELDLHSPEKLLLRQIYEKLQVLFIVTKNQEASILTLQKEQAKLRSAILTLLADPQAREDAMAVIRKFQYERSG